MKKWILCLCCLLLMCWTAAALAMLEDLDDAVQPVEVNWKTLGVKKGTKIPVFGAPFDDAWRGAKGKAYVSSSESFTVLGGSAMDDWLLVSYRVNKKSGRIGWIRTPKGFDVYGQTHSVPMARALLETARNTVLTDDPAGSLRAVRTLPAGEQVIGLFSVYRGETTWACVETEADGKTVWGFVNAQDLVSLPVAHVEGDRLIIHEGVTHLGYYVAVGNEPWPEYRRGDIRCPALYVTEEFGSQIREIVFPSTLRVIGMESVYHTSLRELRMPAGLVSVNEEAFYMRQIDRIVLAQGYTVKNLPGGEYLTIGAWEVESGNPLYSARDGVLFSADGKTLISYPNGKTAVHYDVPAGTEVIGQGAFGDYNLSLPLQTVSLPIGLKRIEARAFSGCGRLHSLTVPLTVTELDPTAFDQCVSLERLSLPPGLHAVFDEAIALREDFSRYTGDNGATLLAPRAGEYDEPIKPDAEHTVFYDVWISGENGEGPVPVYASPEADSPSGQLNSGSLQWVYKTKNGRAMVGLGPDSENWVDLDCLLPISADVFFTVSEIIPTDSGRETLAREGAGIYSYSWFDEDEMAGVFTPLNPDPGVESADVLLPAEELILLRPYTGDQRTFALLNAASGEEPIRLLDAPDGAAVLWTYRGDQAEVLETRGEHALVRISRGQGWVPSACLVIVEQEAP